jgi:hypothetical protein
MARRPPPLKLRCLSDAPLLDCVVADADFAYVAGAAHGPGPRLGAVPLGGGPLAPLLPGDGEPLDHLCLVGDEVFGAVPGALLAVPKAGGAARLVAEAPPAYLWGLVADGATLFGAARGRDGGLFSAPAAGGALSWLHRGEVTAVAAAGGVVAALAGGQALAGAAEGPLRPLLGPERLAALGFARGGAAPPTLIGRVGGEAGALVALDLGGGPPLPLVEAPNITNFVAAEGWLYWTQHNTRKPDPWIWRQRPGAPESRQALARGRSKRGRLTIGPRALVWINDYDGGLHALDLADMPAG